MKHTEIKVKKSLSPETAVGISYIWLQFAQLDVFFTLPGYYVSISAWNMAWEKYSKNNNINILLVIYIGYWQIDVMWHDSCEYEKDKWRY